uniref:Uncharacterized protein n=1 Tax=Bracon brevicornis TaxID=1563983 RepID=A0A6V7LZP3_9HYME
MLAVTLLSPVLVREVLQAKRKVGKFHTTALDPTALTEAGLTTPLMPTLISINEMLPSEIHQLRNAAFIECRGRNYISFVKDGSVFVKKKEEDTPTLITSVEQFNNSARADRPNLILVAVFLLNGNCVPSENI